MTNFSAKDRAQIIQTIQNEAFDLIVIGGGITGAGILLDATSRGLKTLLLEKKDFAYGTSSRSTKLIHGGLRYLKQFDIQLVREVGHERATVHKLAPHLVLPEKMLLPIVENGTFGKLAASIGLKVYDFLAGVSGDDRRIMLSKKETMEQEPLLRTDILKGAGYYAEYRTDDARLTTELIKTAVRMGAKALNYTEVESFIYNGSNKITGVRVTNNNDNTQFDVKASYLVSAAGPWVDLIRKKDNSLEGKHLYHAKGVHIVVPFERLPLKQSMYFDAHDGRMVFAIPRDKVTYIGTTDTKLDENLDALRITKEEVTYLLDCINHVVPSSKIEMKDVISSWAGVRPLISEPGKGPSEISRKDEIFESEQGLISIAGGKLTGYRKMAEKVVDLVVEKVQTQGKSLKNCYTSTIALLESPLKNSKEASLFLKSIKALLDSKNLPSDLAFYYVHNYGAQAKKIIEASDSLETLLEAEARFCIQEEFALTLNDFFIRRTGRLYFYIFTIEEALPIVKKVFQQELGYDATAISEQEAALRKEIEAVTVFI